MKYAFRDRDRAPSHAERRELQVRLESLDRWLTPASSRQLDEVITSMFSTMAYRSSDAEIDLLLVQRIYKDDLAGVPGFALEEACARFRQGAIGDPRFVPKQGEVRQEAIRIAKDYYRERSDVSAILTAKVPGPPPSDEDRAAAVAKYERITKPVLQAARPRNEVMRGFAAEVVEPVPRKTPEEELAELRMRRAAEGPVQVSDSLKAVLARQMAHAKQGDTGGME